jgi:hypothetical protein
VIAISIPIPLITIGWIMVSALIGLFALAQGRSFVSWSVASLIVSPLVGLLLLFLPKPKTTSQKPISSRATVVPSKAAVPVKAVRAFAHHVASSRLIGAISRRKATTYRSLENFTAATEIDKGIAAAVRDEFPNKSTDR